MKKQWVTAILLGFLTVGTARAASPLFPVSTTGEGNASGALLPSASVQAMAAWCNNTLLLLQQARQDAETALAYGDYANAELSLRQGLVDADQAGRRFRGNGPLTARALFRGTQLANAIAGSTAQALSGARTRTYFLFNYYDFVLDVIENLDLPLYLPYRECGMCSRVNATVFEQRFVEYARRQVEMVVNTLAERMGGYGYGPEVAPVGAPEAFLKALEISALNAAGDLRESLWGARHSCAINLLDALASRLATYNAGRGGFYNEVDAVNRAYFAAEEALNNIDDGSCRFGRYR